MSQPQALAQTQTGDNKLHDTSSEAEAAATGEDHAGGSFKFNVEAPEFVPRSLHGQGRQVGLSPLALPTYYYPCAFHVGGTAPDLFFLGDQVDQPVQLISGSSSIATPYNCSKNVVTDDLRHKIIKQVEYQLSDMSLLANDSLLKQINKDPEGYVPISLIASSKRIKALISNNNHLLQQALRSSSKLTVSEDGKKVKRRNPFTERDKEDMQCRTIVAENLPEDHSHANLEKIFSVVGSVKNIRIWHPQESNTPRSKGDLVISNKLHALVEYPTVETAEKAVEKLNDERNWRKGLRVRILLRRTPKSVLKSRKSDFDILFDDEEPPESSEESTLHALATESSAEENSGKKGWGRGRGKLRGRAQSHNGRGLLAPAPLLCCSTSIQNEASTKQVSRGPRMPDGTRGFAIGRGKPVVSAPALTV